MGVLIYSAQDSPAGERLQAMISDQVKNEKIEVCGSIQALVDRLRKPFANHPIVVLVTKSHEELKDLVSVRDLLEGLSSILVLPDSQKNTFLIGQKLYPRYITYSDGSFSVLVQMLDKMLQTSRLQQFEILY